MSTEGALFSLREELKLVSEELAKLSLRVSRLSQNLSALEAVPAAPEWEVVEEGTLPIGVSDISRPYPGAPESPHSPVPEVPRYLLNLCQEKLKATSSTTPKERAERAFAQGHEAWSAIQTGGFYRPASAVPNLPSSHWVILRGLGLQEPGEKPFVSCSVGTIQRSLRTYPSFIEVHAFCIAARVCIPPLKQCGKPPSGSQR